MLPVRVPYKLAPDARVGRLYYVVGPDAGWATPTAAQVVAGLLSGGGAATAAGSQDSPTVTTAGQVLASNAAGLTPGVSYRAAVVWWDGASASAVAVSGVFMTAGVWSVAAIESAAGSELVASAAVWARGQTEAVASGDLYAAAALWVRLLTEPAAGSDIITGAAPAVSAASIIDQAAVRELLAGSLAAALSEFYRFDVPGAVDALRFDVRQVGATIPL